MDILHFLGDFRDLKGAYRVCIMWTPRPVVVAIGDSKDYIIVLPHGYYTTIAGWGVFLGVFCVYI